MSIKFLIVFVLISTSSKVICKQKSETILISDAQNGRQFVVCK